MNKQDLTEVKKALNNHYLNICRLLLDEGRERNNNFLFLAGNLRVLLCDRELPLLIKIIEFYNTVMPITLPFAAKLHRDDINFDFLADPGKIGWDFTGKQETVPIQEFLDLPVGFFKDTNTNTKSSSTYTARQIIKWLANKQGVAHLDLKKPNQLKGLINLKFYRKNIVIDAFLLQQLIYDLSEWSKIAIEMILVYYRLDDLIREEREKYKDYESISPVRFPLQVYFKLKNTRRMFFDGYRSLNKSNFLFSTKHGISINAMIKILYPNSIRDSFILQIQNIENPSLVISIFLTKEFNLVFSYHSINNKSMQIIIKNFVNTHYFNRYIFLTIQLYKKNKFVFFEVLINSELIGEKRIKSELCDESFFKIFVGADASNKLPANMLLGEFFITNKKLKKDEIMSAAKYQWEDWFNLIK